MGELAASNAEGEGDPMSATTNKDLQQDAPVIATDIRERRKDKRKKRDEELEERRRHEEAMRHRQAIIHRLRVTAIIGITILVIIMFFYIVASLREGELKSREMLHGH